MQILVKFLQKKIEYIILNYGTVGNIEETVAFKKATDFLKKEKNISFGKIASKIGLTRSQMDMMRIQRRYITMQELDKFLKEFPIVSQFFEKTPTAFSEPETQPYQKSEFSIKLISALEELLEKERELAALKLQIGELKAENDRLKLKEHTIEKAGK